MIRCERHTAYVYDRGGFTRLWEVKPINLVRWSRRRDDISDATVFVETPGGDCLEVLNNIRSGRHELVIFRDGLRVWEGPITRMGWRRAGVEIHARDVGHYLYRTVMRAEYNNSGTKAAFAVTRVQNICTAELARKEALDPPINVLPHMDFRVQSGDARTSRHTLQRESTVWEDLDSLAHRGGIDYTAIGRKIIVWDTHRSIGQTPMVTETDFLGDVIVTEYGMDLATHTTATDGQGGWGSAGGTDPYYGLVEMLHTAYDEEVDQALPTKEELVSQARRNLAGRNPTPIEVRIPDGSKLNPNGVLTLEHLVAGVHVPLVATLSGRSLRQMQKIDTVSFLEGGGVDEITMTMSPAAGLADVEEG